MKVINNTPILSNATTLAAATTTRISTIYDNSCNNMHTSTNGLYFNKNDTSKMINDDIIKNTATTLFCEQVNTVTNLFEKWNSCERTVVMYALLKRLQYSSLKFLQYSIDSNLTQTMACSTNLNTVVVDMNANNPTYLMKLLQIYRTPHATDIDSSVCTTNININSQLSSSKSDNELMPHYDIGSVQFKARDGENQKQIERQIKEEILQQLINMLPLLKPGNEDAKFVYMQLIPLAVNDVLALIVPFDLVQQIFSYMLIHPAVLSDDRRLLNEMLHHLEEKMPERTASCPLLNLGVKTMMKLSVGQPTLNVKINGHQSNDNNATTSSTTTTTFLSSVINSDLNNYSHYNNGSTSSSSPLSSVSSRNSDWQTIAPPSKYQYGQQQQQQHQQQQQQNQVQPAETIDHWSALIKSQSMSTTTNNVGAVGHIDEHYCDNYNGIKLNELVSSQNSLCLSIGTPRLDVSDSSNTALINGVGAVVTANPTDLSVNTRSSTSSLFGGGNCNSNPIINIINNSGNNCLLSHSINGISEDIADTSFSKNGTEILDFDPNANESFSNSSSNIGQIQSQQSMGYAAMLLNNNCDHLGFNRLSLDSKLGALKTRRSNSLTTQTFLSSTSSSNSSVVAVNNNYSNSTESLAQFANKPRSYSLSIENHRNSLTNSGSDTRLDDFKPNYIKFQNTNMGMSNIGLWLKSLRLHKYLDLFKDMTYETMLQITEDYLINLGVTKGASHKLALCIEKLQDRVKHLTRMEEDLISGQVKLQAALEDLANLVLTPMKPIDSVAHNTVTDNENVALQFFRVLHLICSIIYKETYHLVDDESLGLVLWIIDRMLHNDVFVNQMHQLKEHKFKLSKIKMSVPPKMIHLPKNGSNGNINKSSIFFRWNGKNRKGDQKNGSSDRINYRKNSNDMLLFPLSCLQQSQQTSGDNNTHNNNNNNNNNNHINNANSNNNNNNTNNKSTLSTNGQFEKQHLQYHHHHHHHTPSTTLLSRNSHYSNASIPQQNSAAAATTSTTSNLVLQHSLTLTKGQPQPQSQSKSQQPIANSLRRVSYSNIEVFEDTKIDNDKYLKQRQQLQQLQKQQQMENNLKHIGLIATVNTDDIVQSIQEQQQSQQSQQHSTLVKQLQVRPCCNSNKNDNPILLGNNKCGLLTKHHHPQQQQSQQKLFQQHDQQHKQQQQEQLQLLTTGSSNMPKNNNNNNNCCNNNNYKQLSCTNTTTMNCNMCNDNNITNSNISTTKTVSTMSTTPSAAGTARTSHLNTNKNTNDNDVNSLDQLETLCLQMTEQAIN